MKILSDGPGGAGTTKPGDQAMIAVKRVPLLNPSDSAYDAPSEIPPMANRAKSGSQRPATSSRTRSM
jgi:hypothetical protein